MRVLTTTTFLKPIVMLSIIVLALGACSDADSPGLDDGGRGDGRSSADGDTFGDSSGIGPACVNLATQVLLQPLDMLIALDTSQSMYFDRKWPAVSGAIEAFVADRSFDGLGVGLEFFPEARPCRVEDYEQPDVPIAELPAVQTDIEQALARKDDGLDGTTPTVPMLQGVYKQAVARAEARRERRVVVVLATDGIPDSCLVGTGPKQLSNTLDNVVLLAKEAFEGTPSIPLFVIGVGSDLEPLNRVAAAGGTNQAFLPDVSGDLAGTFLRALDDIRRQAVTCSFQIPEVEDDQEIDFERVNVRTKRGAQEETYRNVTNVAGCSRAPLGGWYYDDPKDPERIILCPETCDRLQRSTGATLEVIFGCKVLLI